MVDDQSLRGSTGAVVLADTEEARSAPVASIASSATARSVWPGARTTPLVHQHFGTKAGIPVGLYRRFRGRTYEKLDAATERSTATLTTTEQVIADAYLDCVDEESAALPGVSGALSGSAELLPFATTGDVTEAAMQADPRDRVSGGRQDDAGPGGRRGRVR